MNVILATWYDEMNQPFMYEFYNEKISEKEIFDFYIKQKQVFKRSVISFYNDTCVFSDGSRVCLTLNKVTETIQEEIIDVKSEPTQLFIHTGDF